MKKTKIKPAYTVDLTDSYTLADTKAAFALGKHNANIPLTDEELVDLLVCVVNAVHDVCICNVKVYEVTKKPWYKRFWNWITRKKN